MFRLLADIKLDYIRNKLIRNILGIHINNKNPIDIIAGVHLTFFTSTHSSKDRR